MDKLQNIFWDMVAHKFRFLSTEQKREVLEKMFSTHSSTDRSMLKDFNENLFETFNRLREEKIRGW